jgi:hypothetical protein
MGAHSNRKYHQLKSHSEGEQLNDPRKERLIYGVHARERAWAFSTLMISNERGVGTHDDFHCARPWPPWVGPAKRFCIARKSIAILKSLYPHPHETSERFL